MSCIKNFLTVFWSLSATFWKPPLFPSFEENSFRTAVVLKIWNDEKCEKYE
jgi:hypothetical protein